MKTDIILAGVGGQGILSIAAIIGDAAINCGMNIKQSEVHGMSQRGGDVQSNLRISDREIASDLIPLGKADLIISLEPLEALRHLKYLSSEGWVVTSSQPFVNIPNYPDIKKIEEELGKHKNMLMFDVETIAKDAGSPRTANIVLLGAAAPFLGMDFEKLVDSVKRIFGRKGEETVSLNIKALCNGYERSSKVLNK